MITFQDDYLNIFTRSYLWQTKHYNVFLTEGLPPVLPANCPTCGMAGKACCC